MLMFRLLSYDSLAHSSFSSLLARFRRTAIKGTRNVVTGMDFDSHVRLGAPPSRKDCDHETGSSLPGKFMDGDRFGYRDIDPDLQDFDFKAGQRTVSANEEAGNCNALKLLLNGLNLELETKQETCFTQGEIGNQTGITIQPHDLNLDLGAERQCLFAVEKLGGSADSRPLIDGAAMSTKRTTNPGIVDSAASGPKNLECSIGNAIAKIKFDSRSLATGGNIEKTNETVRNGGVDFLDSAEVRSKANHERHSFKYILGEQHDASSRNVTNSSTLVESRAVETKIDGSLSRPKNWVAIDARTLPVRANATQLKFTRGSVGSEGRDSGLSDGNSFFGSSTSCAQGGGNEMASPITGTIEPRSDGENDISFAGRGLEQRGELLYPVPISPLPGEIAKAIELERAMAAEMKMNSGPAITRNEVLYEDDFFLVINKPCGVYSEHVLQTVSNSFFPSSVAPQATESSVSKFTLRHAVHNKEKSGLHLHMANRLDRDTSGLMIITKSRSAAKQFSNIFTQRHVQKSYIALCRGSRPKWNSLTIETGHGRSRYGAWRVYARKDVGRSLPGGSMVRDMTTQLLVMAVNKEPMPEQANCCTLSGGSRDARWPARANNEDLNGIVRVDEVGSNSSEWYSHNASVPVQSDEVVIRAIPKTGRTHQIRLHCQMVGLPLRGDVKYSGDHSHDGETYGHHALHAESLSFRHPFNFENLQFVAPLPQWAIDAGMQCRLRATELG